jgi:hypothetical protein
MHQLVARAAWYAKRSHETYIMGLLKPSRRYIHHTGGQPRCGIILAIIPCGSPPVCTRTGCRSPFGGQEVTKQVSRRPHGMLEFSLVSDNALITTASQAHHTYLTRGHNNIREVPGDDAAMHVDNDGRIGEVNVRV